jgi:hypothetical protein
MSRRRMLFARFHGSESGTDHGTLRRKAQEFGIV